MIRRLATGWLSLAICCSAAGASLADSAGTAQARYLATAPVNKVALVVVESAYVDQPLKGALKDAELVRKSLIALGFDVMVVPNVRTRADFSDQALVPFLAKIQPGTFALFYFSGHGFTFHGESYLAPLDFTVPVPEDQVDGTFIPVTAVRDRMNARKPALSMLVLDACRDFPDVVQPAQPEAPGQTKGLVPPRRTPANTMIWFAAGEGDVAIAGQHDEPSLYTTALARRITTPDVVIDDVKRNIVLDVLAATGDRQLPWSNEGSAVEVWMQPSAARLDGLQQLWVTTLTNGDPALITRFSRLYAVSPFAAAARQWVEDHKTPYNVSSSRVPPRAVDAIWDGNWPQPGTVPTLRGAIAFQQTDSASEPAAASDGRYPSSVPEPQLPAPAASAAPGRGKLGPASGGLVALDALTARSAPRTTAGSVATLDPGDTFTVMGTVVLNGKTWLKASLPNRQAPAYVALSRDTDIASLDIGSPLAELTLTAPRDGPNAAVDTKPLVDLLSAVRSGGKTITWVSLATSRPTSLQNEDVLALQTLGVGQALAGLDIPGSMVSRSPGASIGPGVRVRIFGQDMR